ncbi:PQ loop repeat family protein [Tritrichomonas foetus]|uniref:PQ loop repeat family protein n=1 Tax=Tritrichomonas foetus TaxID=1144522 RepID=A0A1J4K1Z3_9EUKA|nr:PQ loop repeat family protein [Tritrichomonas foetus]|eukprot:OHT03758.1 PQ loop repeat family protein [Tritrichomonas foetus]
MNISVLIYHIITSLWTRSQYAHFFGNISTLCFFLVYIPQIYMVFSLRSTEGFSLSSAKLKLLGSAFLCVNSIFKGDSLPLILYGFLNTVELIFLLLPFFLFNGEWKPLLYIGVVFIPLFICKFMPELIPFTDYIKPITQLMSNIPQLYQCMKVGTTRYVSMFSLHLHFGGSIFGFMMLIILQNFSFYSWFIYGNSFLQAFSVYIAAAWFGELRFFDAIEEENENENTSDGLNITLFTFNEEEQELDNKSSLDSDNEML